MTRRFRISAPRLALPMSLGLALVATGAAAQPAPRALDTFQSVCAKDLSHDATAAALAEDGWQPAPPELEALFGQDILDPDDARRFVIDTGDGTLLAAAMTERRGLLGTRNRTLCFVRLFLETPDPIRADFRARMGAAPDNTTDSDEVRADLWGTIPSGRIVGLRAVNLPEGFWMITVSRTLADG